MPDSTNLLKYNLFKPHNNLLAFTTTKQTINAGNPRFTGDSEKLYSDNRKKLSSILNIQEKQLIFPRQTHTSNVAESFDNQRKELKEIDALVTAQTGVCLCVQTADCVPILLFEPAKRVIAAVHAGWRGTVSCITGRAVETMENKFGADAKNILAAIGPSISPEVYEVGDEVIRAVEKNIPEPDKSILEKNGNFHFNLWEANRQILLRAGLSEKNIEIAGECSFLKPSRYYSARRDGMATGRMVSGIMMV